MTAKQMLALGGFPDTDQGRAAFYAENPTKEAFMKKYAKGGNTELAFPQAPDSNQFYNIGVLPNFPGPYYAGGGSHMPYTHYRMAGEIDPQAAQAMMDNEGGNIPFATRQMGEGDISELPTFEDGGMDPRSMAEQLLTIRNQYESMTSRQLKKERNDIQESLSNPYQENDPSLEMRLSVITELLGESEPMMQKGGIAFPQQPENDQFFTGASFNNEYRKGGAPCYKCGGMYDTGGNTPFNYGYFPMGMDGGGSIGLDTTDNSDYLSYQTGGQSPQGLTMENYRTSQTNQFKDFLNNTSQAYTAGQIIQQGEMGALPENKYGGYDANDAFSSVNRNNLYNIDAYQNAADELTDENAGKKFMGSMFDIAASFGNNKNPKAKYGYSLPKHQTTGSPTTATNTGAAGSKISLSDDEIKMLQEMLKSQQTNKQSQNQPNMIFNPFTGNYSSLGYDNFGYPGDKYTLKYRDAEGRKMKLKGKGSPYASFPYAGQSNTQGVGTQQSNIQGIPPGMNPDDFSKYMDAMNKAGFKGNITQKTGIFGRPKSVRFDWSFGNPAAPMQGPAPAPAAAMNPSKIATTPISTSQYPTTNPSYSGVQDMTEKMMNESGYGFKKGGYNDSDVVWMDEDDIRRFEAGGGVLEYLDGGEFKQYY